jgi:hypothetical protein
MPLVQRDELGSAGLDGDEPVPVFALAYLHACGRVVRDDR